MYTCIYFFVGLPHEFIQWSSLFSLKIKNDIDLLDIYRGIYYNWLMKFVLHVIKMKF